MNERERDAFIFNLAKEFLPSLRVPGVTEQLVQKYLQPSVPDHHVASLSELYKRLLESAQNANMKAGVIGRALGGIDKLGTVLYDFNPTRVADEYQNPEVIFTIIRQTLRPTGKMRQTTRSIWPQYCRTILSSAKFINQFSTADDFYRWVELFDNDNRARVALPMILAEEIDGFGFALSCDFLKELGFINFAKPDVHIRDIFKALDLCAQNANDYHLFKSVIRVAEHAGVSPYAADKVFWLIGSGYFYDDLHIGKNGRIGSNKRDFIRFVKQRLSNGAN